MATQPIPDDIRRFVLTSIPSVPHLEAHDLADERIAYRYQPASPAMRSIIDRLTALYASHLLEVTHLIHSTLDRKGQLFADAFKWRKDT
jgi:hypothetical protein